jgi:hypothetical protein
MKTHKIKIISLYDAIAECDSCGWYYAFTGEKTVKQLKQEHKKSHRRKS